MNWDSLFQIIVLLGSGGVLSVAAKALVDRKKIRVDSVAILSDTAMKQADNAQRVADKAQARVDEMEEEMAKLRQSILEHNSWDWRAMSALHQAGIDIGPPPELWPTG